MYDIQSRWSFWIADRMKEKIIGSGDVEDFLRAGTRRNIIHLLIFPSFTPLESYELIDHERTTTDISKRYEVLRITWDMHNDLHRVLKGQSPNFLVKNAFVPPAVVDRLFSSLQQPIPVWMSPKWEDQYIGVDGAFYEIKLGGGFLGMHLQWWSHSPKEWLPLTEAFNNAVNEFEKLLQ